MRQNIAKKLLDKIEAEVNVYRMHVGRLLQSVDIRECKIHSYDVDEYGGPINIANTVRALWRLPSGPIRNLVQVVENAGGVVVLYDFRTQKIDGLSHWIHPLPPIFFINMNIPGDRFRFSLAHELGHAVMHTNPKPDMEKEADLFAAELLMPARDVAPSLQPLTLSKLADLKMYWKVSMASLIYRAETLKRLPAHKILYLRKQMGTAGYRTKEPIEIPREEPTTLSEVVEIYLKEMGFTVTELCKMLSIYEDEFDTLYKRRHLRLAS
jgi:Zn-dependent peptidase ImmA (M78 family)